MKRIITIIFAVFIGMLTYAAEPDIIVTQDGESLKVYNLEITPKTVYYTLTEDPDADLKRLSVDAVLVIKKADGTKIDPSAAVQAVDSKALPNVQAHEAITCEAISEITTDKKGNKIVSIKDGNGQLLYMRIVPDEDKTMAVTKWQGKGKYEGKEYVIPEYVRLGEDVYTVKYIDHQAFYLGSVVDTKYLEKVRFPNTLLTIGDDAFAYRACLTSIVLPDGLERIGDRAFRRCGTKQDVTEVYIPRSVKVIGKDAFAKVGQKFSPRGYFQGNLTSIPDYVTEDNCDAMGIDDSAVRAYKERQSKK